MQRRDKIIFQKVLAEISIAQDMTKGITEELFLSDEKLKRAVCMTVINIGELIKNVSEEMKSMHTNVQWRAIAGMRDITAHRYQTLRMEDVYSTVQIDLPVLKNQLSEILAGEK